VPCEEGDASGLGLFSGAFGLHHGGLQRAGPVAWLPAHHVGFVPLSIAAFSLYNTNIIA
jgi:hypothetical protein